MASSSWWLDNVGPTDNVQSAISERVLVDRFCIAAPYENRHRPAVVYGLFQATKRFEPRCRPPIWSA